MRRFRGSGIDSQVLKEVRAPTAWREGADWLVRIYADRTPGMVRYDFLIRADDTVAVSIQPYPTILGA
jgi:hypothetical protein